MAFALEYEDAIEREPIGGRSRCECRACAIRRSASFESADPGWTGSPEQGAFRERVLQAHIARSRAGAIRQGKSGDPAPDIPSAQLAPVDGTANGPNRTQLMRKDAAKWAGQMLQAANQALAKAKREGDPDALRTVSISANSGYRSPSRQRDVWRRYFGGPSGYYQQTQLARQALPGGPHSAAAVSYMLDTFRIGNRIAAPGYSNHNRGLAIDLWQYRSKGFAIPNKTEKGFPNGGGPLWKRWRATWLFKWLTTNAASFHFYPYTVEPWHWEYGASGPMRESESPARRSARRPNPPPKPLAGKLGGFTASALPLKVAVYCPKEALSQSSVDVVLYCHGLNICGVPAKIPQDFITKAPFRLGAMADDSLSGAVLVVPFMEWTSRSLDGVDMRFGPNDRYRHPRWHKLAIPANLNRTVAEALDQVGRMRGTSAPSLRRLIIAGHSRAYDFFDPLANAFADPEMSRGALATLSQVWALDSSYTCPVADWVKWLRSKPNLKVSMFFRPGSSTADQARCFATASASVGNQFPKPAPVKEEHCDVPVRRLPALLAALAPARQPEAEQETNDSVVRRVCAISANIARHASNKNGAAEQINRLSRQLLPRLPQFTRQEIDRLTGCMGRVEHAIGRETVPMRRFRAAARQLLGEVEFN